MKNASLIGLLACMFSVVILVFRESIFGIGPIAITIQVLSAILMLWARLTFGQRSFHASANPTEGGLVTTGPYHFLRHPIYAAIIYFTWAGFSSHLSIINFILTFTVTIGLTMRLIAEEFLVAERYPEYRAYARKTKRIIPFII